MITLLEKRIQDLEARIPIYLAKIEEQQKKMAEIYSFPNDLAEVKTLCNTLNKVLKEFMDSQKSGWDAANTRATDLWKAMSGMTSTVDGEVKQSISNTSSQIGGLTTAISDQKAKQSALENNHNDLKAATASISERVARAETNIEKANQGTSLVQNKLNSHIVDHNNMQVAFETKLNQLSEDFKGAFHSINANISAQITQVSSKIKDVPPASVPKSYDADIADIKKDIVSILSLVHSTASQGPDPKVNDKIKHDGTKHLSNLYSPEEI